jgi:signal transduction histidine kinase
MTTTADDISSQIHHLTHFCASHDEVDLCVSEIERTVGRIHAGASCAVYLLDRQYQKFQRYTSKGDYPDSIDLSAPSIDKSTFAWKCYRGKTLIGLIAIREAQIRKPELLIISDVVCLVYGRLFAANIFANVHIPINYHQPEDLFFKELELLTRFSAGMSAGAFRELDKDGKSLTTIFAWNLDYESSSVADWDIDSSDFIPEFWEVIDTRKPKALNSIDPSRAFFKRPEQGRIKSAVLSPVLVGKDIFGVLSFAQHIPYEYSELEINGFLSIANAAGIAIQNFRQASLQNEEVGIAVRNSTVFTALEVAQAARHTAKGVIDTVNVKLAALIHYVQNRASGELRQGVTSELSSLSDDIFMITKALDDIKAASKPPKNELIEYDLKTIWEEAKRQLLGKLNTYRIGCRWDGADVIIHCFPDQIRQMFLNLIINSIDAFTRGTVAGRRIISLRPEVLPNVKNIKLIYSDNAGGLDIQALRPWKREENEDFTELIFKKDVTTKGDEGSGWGLYICRRVMDRHQGSISVADHRRGMTFVIHIPKDLSNA